ncbi:hypothetical protein DFR86_09810 [Acidianus sulfidivorans JP7]|uniref:hypothetical protein n=1 Tax=Acidianus sulfidivorans TaxID=312539 RepID=UPI0014434C01|nr:hypothetical protein [Acidianus sulfidivorans]QIJ32897.1 hypothetical protein DFR86_09810 [Acidianus sulfidivorans JP7]
MNLTDLLSLGNEELQKAIEYGISEAQYLGKEFIGITLSNGNGIILHVNPYEEKLQKILIMTMEEIKDKKLVGIFHYEGGNTYFIYEITDLSEIQNILNNQRILYVQVISDVLEDFLLEAMDR